MPRITPAFTENVRKAASTPNFGTASVSGLPAARLKRQIDAFLLAGDIARHSRRTLESRRERLSRLVWLSERQEWETVGVDELRRFFHYLNHGHEQPGGRWGNPRQTRPMTPGRVKSYFSTFRTFFAWMVDEGELPAPSPMARIPVPIDRPDQVEPFTAEQCRALIAAARRTTNPVRDTAIVLVLLDCGLRASELCALTCGDVDLENYQIRVREGKGGKSRTVPFSRETRRALFNLLRENDAGKADPAAPVFTGGRGRDAGTAILSNGLRQLVYRLGEAARVRGVHPHRFRHTAAVSFLRAGGNAFALKTILGHTSLHQTNRYVALAQADVAAQHRQFSPVEWLNGQGKA